MRGRGCRKSSSSREAVPAPIFGGLSHAPLEFLPASSAEGVDQRYERDDGRGCNGYPRDSRGGHYHGPFRSPTRVRWKPKRRDDVEARSVKLLGRSAEHAQQVRGIELTETLGRCHGQRVNPSPRRARKSVSQSVATSETDGVVPWLKNAHSSSPVV